MAEAQLEVDGVEVLCPRIEAVEGEAIGERLTKLVQGRRDQPWPAVASWHEDWLRRAQRKVEGRDDAVTRQPERIVALVGSRIWRWRATAIAPSGAVLAGPCRAILTAADGKRSST